MVDHQKKCTIMYFGKPCLEVSLQYWVPFCRYRMLSRPYAFGCILRVRTSPEFKAATVVRAEPIRYCFWVTWLIELKTSLSTLRFSFCEMISSIVLLKLYYLCTPIHLKSLTWIFQKLIWILWGAVWPLLPRSSVR